jgi:hypothetical protein
MATSRPFQNRVLFADHWISSGFKPFGALAPLTGGHALPFHGLVRQVWYPVLMAAIKLTAKRQATLPRSLCEDLDVHPGDEIALERRVLDGETIWIMRPRKVDWSWFGAASVPANATHDMQAIRASIAQGRGRR